MKQPVDRAEHEVREQLRELRVDLPDDGFELSLHRRLVEAGPPAPVPGLRRLFPAAHLRRWIWPLAGALAGAVVFLALTVLQPGGSRSGGLHAATASVAVVPESKVAVVRLELTADVAVADADLRISLPEGLVFWSEGAALADRSFEWRQPLSRGKNEFPIAVRGQHPGVYRVRLTAQVGESSVQHDVTLAVVDG
jgi:hypothetical protein